MKRVIGFTINTTSKKRVVSGIVDGHPVEIEAPMNISSEDCLELLIAAAKPDQSDPSISRADGAVQTPSVVRTK